jgi:hypothetical protein
MSILPALAKVIGLAPDVFRNKRYLPTSLGHIQIYMVMPYTIYYGTYLRDQEDEKD